MHHHITTNRAGSTETPLPLQRFRDDGERNSAFGDLSKLAVPSISSLNQADPAPGPSSGKREPHPPSLKSSIARLNAKIAIGELGAFATVGALACAGVSGLLQNASTFTMVALTLLSATTVAIKSIRSQKAIHEISTIPTPSFHQVPLFRVREIVRPLCEQNNIPEPHIVISGGDSANAGMLDRLHHKDVLLLTESLLSTLNDRELRGVIAHELAHQNRWYSRFQETTSLLSEFMKPIASWGTMFFTVSALAPITGVMAAPPLAIAMGVLVTTAAAMVVRQFCNYVSRHNEVKTDLRACAMTGDPEGLISALSKLEPSTPEYLEVRKKLAQWGLLSHPSFQERAEHIRRAFGHPNS